MRHTHKLKFIFSDYFRTRYYTVYPLSELQCCRKHYGRNPLQRQPNEKVSKAWAPTLSNILFKNMEFGLNRFAR